MIYYMIRLKMKYHYYIAHNMKRYNKLNQVSNKYKDEFGKPLFFERVVMSMALPVIYPLAYLGHKREKENMLRKWRRFNRYFVDAWIILWRTGEINTTKYFKPTEVIEVH